MSVTIDMQLACRQDGIPSRKEFHDWIQAAMPDARQPTEVALRIVDESEMTKLNQRYRGKSGSTNVLSFPFEAPADVPTDLLGDIIICAPVIEREAHEQGKPVQAHWAHMAIHGTLHLLGYDHVTEQQAEAMEAHETRILSSLGYADPYTVVKSETAEDMQVNE